jgi:hypothetical protein
MGFLENVFVKPWTFQYDQGKKLYDNYKGNPNQALEDREARQRAGLELQGGQASDFANASQSNVGQLGAEAAAQREMLRKRANGEGLMSPEILRQGLQQQYAQQRSMAAGAAPQNAAMAARTAAMGMGRASSGMAGQSALAQLQERQAAEKALGDSIMNQRQQDMQGSLGSRANSTTAYGVGIAPQEKEKSDIEKYGPAVVSALGMAMSDKRLKTDIKDGDAKAKRVLEGLKAYSYKYKDEKHGKGEQYGLMAQDMERNGLGHAVEDTSEGKAVNGAKAALSSLALSAALARRVSKLEKKDK